MCNKYATPTLEQMTEYMDMLPAFQLEDFKSYYIADAYAHQLMPITTNEEPSKIQSGIWGFVPGWATEPARAKEMADMCVNAVSEKIFETASYKNHIVKQRCLIWVQGFYEHQWRNGGKQKIPHFIYMADGKPFTFGGVYSNYTNPVTGEVYKTFSVITTAANELMAEVHNNKKRMPYIVTPENRERWLGDLSKEEIQQMMQPLSDGLLKCHTISKLITSRKENPNVPQVQDPFNYERALF